MERGASLAELARNSSLAKRDSVQEGTSDLPKSATVSPSDQQCESSSSPGATSSTADVMLGVAQREDRESGERLPFEDFSSLSVKDRFNALLSEMQANAERVAQLQRRLEEGQRSQAQVDKRFDEKHREQSLAVQGVEQKVQELSSLCSMEKMARLEDVAKQDAKILEVKQMLSGDPSGSILSAIDDRLSAVCLRLEGAAPVLARAELPRLDRIERIDEEASPPRIMSPGIDKIEEESSSNRGGQQVSQIRRELLGVIEEANARIVEVERRCGSIESTLSGAIDGCLRTIEGGDFAWTRALKESLQGLEAEQNRRYDDLKEQLETLAKAGDDDVAGLSTSVAAMRDSLQECLVEHKEIYSRLTEPSMTDLVKMKEDILGELGAQYQLVRDQTIQMTAEHVTRQTDKIKNIIAKDRQDREVEMENALTAAVSTVFKNLATRERGFNVTEDDKDASVKTALAVLSSVSTKAPSNSDQEEFPVVVRTLASTTPPVCTAAWEKTQAATFASSAPVPRPVPAGLVANAVQALESSSPPWSPTKLDFRQPLSPLHGASRDQEKISVPSRVPEVKKDPMRKDALSASTFATSSRNLRHTLSPNMISTQHQHGLTNSPPMSSRRTLSPTNMHVASAQELKFASQRRILGQPSSPAMRSRQ